MTDQPRDEMTPDAMARDCGWSYERNNKAMSWEDFCEELGRRYEVAASSRSRSVSTVEAA